VGVGDDAAEFVVDDAGVAEFIRVVEGARVVDGTGVGEFIRVVDYGAGVVDDAGVVGAGDFVDEDCAADIVGDDAGVDEAIADDGAKDVDGTEVVDGAGVDEVAIWGDGDCAADIVGDGAADEVGYG